jgi:phospholipid/cholesterol/gamma-HCH transport system substrate-binding protein
METRANFVLIGSFTLAVIAAAFGFVLWFQSLHTTKARSPIRIIFEGPASGLRNGGSVNFNGIRIGEVVSVKLDNPRRVVALAMVGNDAPIRKDTLVGLEFQGLTGVAAISLKGGEEAAPSAPLDEDGVPVLTADPNALQDVTEAIRGTLQNINRVVADNQEAVKNSLHNLETFTSSLARNAEKIDNVMLKVDGVMGKADNLMLGLNTLAGGKEGGELFQAVKSIRELAEAGRYQPRGEQSRQKPDAPVVWPGKRQRAGAGGPRAHARSGDRGGEEAPIGPDAPDRTIFRLT